MAMTKCKECKQPVSDSAKVCPHCGIKDPGVTAKSMFFGVIILVAIIWGVFAFFNSDSDKEDKPTAEQLVEAEAACKQDLQCWGNKYNAAVGIYCKSHIEKLAQYSSKWTDGLLEPKFSHFKWLNKDKGYVTYIGDKIQFQNGYGAMSNYIYECDFDPETDSILAVRARPGHL